MQPQNQQDIMGKLLTNKKILFIIIGGLLLLVIVVSVLLANSGNPAPGRVAALQSHLDALGKLSREQGDELSSSSLRDQNANISILVAGASNDIGAVVTEVYGAVEPNKQSLARNAARLTAIQAALQESISTNTLDMEYQEQMAAELQTIEAQLASLGSDSRASVRQVLEDIRERLSQGRAALEKVSL